MPLDINLFRVHAGGDPEIIRESQRRRFASVELVDQIIAKDDEWRKMTGDVDNLRKQRNAVQKEVGAKMKAKEPCDAMVADIKRIGDEIVALEEAQKTVKAEVDRMLTHVGNLVDASVPVSQDEDADNRVERKWGTPRDPAGTSPSWQAFLCDQHLPSSSRTLAPHPHRAAEPPRPAVAHRRLRAGPRLGRRRPPRLLPARRGRAPQPGTSAPYLAPI